MGNCFSSSDAAPSDIGGMRFVPRKNLDYKLGSTLGQGGFATVKEAYLKEDQSKWAIKFIEHTTYKRNKKEIDDECALLGQLKHKGIVGYRENFRTDKPSQVCIVMQHLGGGELFDRIINLEKYTEEAAKVIVKEMCETMDYLHTKRIVHRDLKPENFVFVNESDDSPLTLIDFGFATEIEQGGSLMQQCGTPEYVAPEILDDDLSYDMKADMWSIGVIVYILLCGFPPFYGDTDEELYDKILHGDFEFVAPFWDGISEDARDFINSLLKVNPSKRLSAAAALKHKWFKGTHDGDIAGVSDNLKRYKAVSKLRRGVFAIQAQNRLADYLKG